MRPIGVNQWAGLEPAFAESLVYLQKQLAKSQQTGAEKNPSDAFFRLANKHLERPRRYGVGPVEGYWKVGSSTLVEFTRIALSDVDESERFLVHLQTLYVVDADRGKGEGKRVLDKIKELAEEAGCGVTLFATAFALSRDGELPYAVESFDDLWKAACEEVWPVVYLPKWDEECLRFFYESSGFRNMCLYDPWVFDRPKENDQPFESQFAFLPESLKPLWRSRLTSRLNKSMCDFCNR
jgi:GNAT superfamily N-acetyltransferase